MTTGPIPRRTDVKIDSYALVIHEEGQVLYQYDDPVLEDPKWIEKTTLDHSDAPTLELGPTQVEQRTSDDGLQAVVLYTTSLDVSHSDTETSSDDDPPTDDRPYQGFVIRFSDGTEIPHEDTTIHTTQAENMREAINYLVTHHNLITEIELPYTPPRARKNCSINSKPFHPNGDEMRSPYELTGGYYLHTSLNSQAKQTRIEDLANQVGVSVDEFLGEWE